MTTFFLEYIETKKCTDFVSLLGLRFRFLLEVCEIKINAVLVINKNMNERRSERH